MPTFRRVLALAISATFGATAVASAQAEPNPDGGYTAEIRRTAFGVPHIRATDHGGLGFGMGYAFAEDNLCELMEMVATAEGSRSLHFGADRSNLERDFYFRRLVEIGEAESALTGPSAPSPAARALVRGYAVGVNQYLRDTGVANLPDPRCRNGAWVREIDEIDVYRLRRIRTVPLLSGTVAAAPPGTARSAALDEPMADAALLGSNAWGIGSELSRGGRGVLLGNPHYPWDGINRFYRAHLTIPGVLDVVGAALFASPFIGMGHTERVAWTHTVSTATRYGLFELPLVEGRPTAFLRDGAAVEMTSRTIRVPVRNGDGSLGEVAHTFYETPLGLVVHTEGFPWTRDRAFVVATPAPGLRVVDQYLAIYDAADVRQLRDALLRWQATDFNTTAVDATGEAFFGDVGAIPHVTDAHAARCIASDIGRERWREARLPVLDGSRSDCAWGTDSQAVVQDILGPDHLPQLFRRDYVGQFNDSYWLTSPRQPIEGLPRILGEERTQRSLRTRLGIGMLEDRIEAGNSKFDLETVAELMFDNRNLGAEMVLKDLVHSCRDQPTARLGDADIRLDHACEVLADWDARVDLDSRGAHLFREFARLGGIRFAEPFDPADPVATPRRLDVGDPRVLAALAGAIRLLESSGIPLDAPLGAVQTEPRGDRRIPIHGGPGAEGVFNVITAPFVEGAGYPKITSGSSFVMVVEFTDDGPRSRGLLTYSQSTDPTSPHFADQTELYSRKGWDDLRFTDAEILADPELRVYTVRGEGTGGR
jgi:acyl-homoserine-lactone acylase